MTNPISELTALGQSLWYDNIQRRLLENGELAAMIERGDIRGVTSNPTIFHNAIAKSNDYDLALTPLAMAGWSSEEIFWQLAVEDIRAACDLFLPLYEQTEGADGYVSLEVSPYLAHDTEGTIAQARHLWHTVNRPNLMIKIPATKAGLPAIRRAIAEGINVNVTLIFSLERYREVMDAYLSGLEDRLLAGGEIERIHSVASFFVSRVDTKVDPKLPENSPLRGKAAIANAKLAYEEFRKVFGGARFGKLQMAKANLQRPLWASTSTKNPAYPDTIYVDNLIGPATVNTVPPQTLVAFKEHGTASQTIMEGLDEARQQIADLEQQGILMSTVTQELEEEGVKAFADAFTALLETLERRRQEVISRLGGLAHSIKERVANLEKQKAVERMWNIDPTLWTDDPAGQAEIRIRLGWLSLPETSRPALPEIKEFAAQVHSAGFTHFLLLGMGGSSLAPEVMSLVFSSFLTGRGAGGEGGLRFAILDSTDPGQVAETAARFPLEKTLLLVSSKSGGTAEVNAMFDYFWAKAVETLGERAGDHFVAITDPGTSLEALAKERRFRRIFTADPHVGGRYSALAHFGLVPAALMGIDTEKFLARAARMMSACRPEHPAVRNPGLVLGALIGQAALEGRDKLTIVADNGLESVGSWLEQLIAESTGKQGKGIVPVDLEPLGAPSEYGNDRLFVYLRKNGEHDAALAMLRQAGHPLVVFDLTDPYDLSAEFYRWEFATAVACAVLGVNAFDQPDVQDAKDRTKAKIAEYRARGALPAGEFVHADDAPAALAAFLSQARTGDYIAINAYLRRNAEMQAALTDLRLKLRARTGCATTVGFGPRFLHSTGQLHKGGAENGLFLQITADSLADIEIPGQGMTFGTLERAQALGDYEALAARNRRILRIHLEKGNALKELLSRMDR
ncbi:MAG: bifunctional transaldolase/phosoglucose isomerase [Anaerolineales bacterium]|nr:bifunctional transaldolase/phosoglucose isomerase [Anaerolineales bacterium]MDW8278698.1 bifunctional transaldolase/phosoglucose isomerase [Anaerolineales bacterium]